MTEASPLTVRYFSEQDVATRVDWINNPAINESMFFELPATVEKTLAWSKSIVQNKRRIDFTFVDRDINFIAMGGFTEIDPVHKNAEFYIMVNPAMHGKGYGKKISKWLYNYAFLTYDLNKIYLYTNDSNHSAYKIYENSGFKLEGIMRSHKWKNGAFQDRRFYGLLQSEWREAEWKTDTIQYNF